MHEGSLLKLAEAGKAGLVVGGLAEVGVAEADWAAVARAGQAGWAVTGAAEADWVAVVNNNRYGCYAPNH